MTRPGLSLAALGLLGAALGATLFLELHTPLSEPAMPEPALRPVRRPVLPGTAAADPTEKWVAAILGRPLFDPQRRPPATAVAAPEGQPRLTGVLVGPFGRQAIFAAPGGKPVVVAEGGHIGGMTVETIRPGEVAVLGPDGRQILHPVFGAPPSASPAAPAALPGLPRLSQPVLPPPLLPGRAPQGFPALPGLPHLPEPPTPAGAAQ